MFERRIVECDELQRLGTGSKNEHQWNKQRNGKLVDLGSFILRHILRHGADELPQQSSGSVQHGSRNSRVLRFFYDIRYRSFGDIVSRMEKYYDHQCLGISVWFSHNHGRHILAECFQRTGNIVQRYQEYCEAKEREKLQEKANGKS